MKNMIVAALLALLVSGCSTMREHKLYQGDPSQAARIVSYDTVLINYVDDEDMGVSFIGQHQTYDIKAGKHVLLVEYADMFDVGADDHEKVVSRPAKITFVAEPGKQYQVRHPEHKKLEDAKQFAEEPAFWMVDLATGARIDTQVELSRPRSFFEGLKLQNKPEYQFASDQVNQPAAAPVAAQSNVPAGDLTNLKMLQYSWKNATEQERTVFLEWIKQPQ